LHLPIEAFGCGDRHIPRFIRTLHRGTSSPGTRSGRQSPFPPASPRRRNGPPTRGAPWRAGGPRRIAIRSTTAVGSTCCATFAGWA
jgi:hypothetical protein